MKKTILLYGLALALLTFLLKGIEYRYYLRELSVEFYVGAVAVLFSGLGIWMGLKLTQAFRRKETPRAVSPKEDPDPGTVEKLGISPRELEVLRLIAAGLSNQQIAAELVVALDTVKKHTTHIYGKLGVRGRTQAVARARELDLL